MFTCRYEQVQGGEGGHNMRSMTYWEGAWQKVQWTGLFHLHVHDWFKKAFPNLCPFLGEIRNLYSSLNTSRE